MPNTERVRTPNVLTPNDSLYPVGSEPEMVLVTPEMASDWLTARRSPQQRNISASIVAKYLRDMREGRWKLTRQGLTFDSEGHNIDGQHRLRALANCDRESLEKHYGTPGLMFWIYPNEPADTFDAYDQNFKRTAAHLINEQYSTNIAAAARLLTAARDQDPWTFPRLSRITNPEILQTRREWPEISRYVAKATVLHKPTHISIPEHLTVLAQAARTEHADKIEDWFTALHHGTDMTNGDARLHLRNRFMSNWLNMSGSNNRPLRYSLIVKAWNAYALGQDINVLRWSQNETIPTVEGFSWEDNA